MSTAASRDPEWRIWLIDARDALTGLWATPRYSLPAIVSLALGIGATTAVFAVFSALLLRPLPFGNPRELVQVELRGANVAPNAKGALSPTFAAEYEQQGALFANFAASKVSEVTLEAPGLSGGRRGVAIRATPGFFDTLQIEPVLGRLFTAGDTSTGASEAAVLRRSFWQSAFGGADVVGQTLLVDGAPKTILGVIDDDQALPDFADLWLPWQLSPEERSEQRFNCTLFGIGRLLPGVSLGDAQLGLDAFSSRQHVSNPDGWLVSGVLTPLREALLGQNARLAGLLQAAVTLFLLVACANVASLLVTRAAWQERQLAVRAALGASAGDLARQTGMEAVLIAGFGSSLGLLLAAVAVRAANQRYAAQLSYAPARLDGSVAAAFVVVCLVSALLIGVLPAYYAYRVRPMQALRGSGRVSTRSGPRQLSKTLVLLQVAAVVALLGNTGVLIRSIGHLEAIDPGFDPDVAAVRVLLPPTPVQSAGAPFELEDRGAETRARAVLERVEAWPGVAAAALATDLPFDGNITSAGLDLERGASSARGYADIHLVGPRYFDTLGIRLLAGRAFSAADAEPKRPEVAIVNRSFARRLLGTEDAVGLSFGLSGAAPDGSRFRHRIVGVVADTIDTTLTAHESPVVYFPFSTRVRFYGNGFVVVARGAGDPTALLHEVEAAIQQAAPEAPRHEQTLLGTLVQGSYWRFTALQQVLGVFGILSVGLAAVGLFGVTSYAVAERAAEIGIRRALGASRLRILVMILRETSGLLALGIGLGLVAGYFMRDLLASFVYGVGASDPLTYGVVAVGTLAVALLAVLPPALAAAAVAPARALGAGA